MNSLQVPHIFNHFECCLSNATPDNFSHCVTQKNRSLIMDFFCIFLIEVPFLCLISYTSLSPVLSSSMCQCAVTLSQRAVVFGAVKWTCVASAVQMRCPHTLWLAKLWTYDMSCSLSGLHLFSWALFFFFFLSCVISDLSLNPHLTKHSYVFDFICIFSMSSYVFTLYQYMGVNILRLENCDFKTEYKQIKHKYFN